MKQRYVIQKAFGTGWQTVFACKRLYQFDVAYSLMESEAYRNPGTAYRIRSNNRTVGVPLTIQREAARS